MSSEGRLEKLYESEVKLSWKSKLWQLSFLVSATMGYYSYNFVDPDFFHNTLGLYATFPFMSWAFNEKLYKRY